MTSVIRPAARQDILRQYRYYLIEKDAETTAERFLEAVQTSIGQLARQPEIGKPYPFESPTLSGLRSWPVKGFPSIRIYYQVSGDTLRVIRVLHGKRDINPTLEDDSPGV